MSVAHGLHRTFRAFGSSRWTPWGLGVLAVVAQLATTLGWSHADVVVAPLLLLALNLVAALLTRPRFRNDLPLLVMHLALIAFLLMLVVSLLTRYEAQVVLGEGQAFSGVEMRAEARATGYPGGVESLRFVNEGVLRAYNPDGTLRARYNMVRWQQDDVQRRSKLGKAPLVIDGHAIYATRNWGHTALLLWQSEDGGAHYTNLSFAPWREGIDQFGERWQPVEGARPLWIGLEFGDMALDPLHDGRAPGDAPDGVRLVVRDGTDRWLLAPGDSLALPGLGLLGYQGLTSWMGYDVIYDPIKSSLLAVSLVLVLAMTGFYLRRVRTGSWRRRSVENRPDSGRAESLPGEVLEE